MLPGIDLLPEQDPVGPLLGILDRDYRIATGRDGGAGHDTDSAARGEGGNPGLPGRNIAGDPQDAPRPAVGRTHGEPVHG